MFIFVQNKIIMAGNSYGTLFKLTTFGESHGEALGGIIDGCPAGIELNFEAIQHEMQRRKPGQSAIVTQRKEEDEVQFLSGIFEGKTTGTPIGFVIPNTNQKSDDYSHIKDTYRLHQKQLDAIENEEERFNKFVEVNVKEQVFDLAKTSIVQNAWQNNQPLFLHGWVYGLNSGYVTDLDVNISSEKDLDDVYQLKF